MNPTLNEKLEKLRAELELDETHAPTAYRVGTVRTWKSGRFKKTATGWVPVTALVKKGANTPKGATAHQDLKHAAFGKITHDVKTFINTPGVVTFVPGKKKPETVPHASLSKGSTPSYTHQSKAGGSSGATPTPSQSAAPAAKPGGVMGGKNPHFGGTMPHRYENGECVYCGAKKPDNEAIEPSNTTYGGFRRLAGLVDDRVLEAEEVPAVAKYADNPAAYNAQIAKLMAQLKRDKNAGVTGIRQGYKGSGTQGHKRQIWVKMPTHDRGGPDVWLDNGFVKVGGIIDIPKSIPNMKKYGDESPEAVYKWIADTVQKVKAFQDAKYADSPAIAKEDAPLKTAKAMPWPTKGPQSKPKPVSVGERMSALRAELEEGSVANMSDDEVVKTARALANKAHKGKLSSKEGKDFAMAMQRIKDEGLLGDDDVKDIWKWHGGGGQ